MKYIQQRLEKLQARVQAAAARMQAPIGHPMNLAERLLAARQKCSELPERTPEEWREHARQLRQALQAQDHFEQMRGPRRRRPY